MSAQIRLTRVDVPVRAHAATSRISCEPVGYLGAREGDREAWLAGWRRVLDGLAAPLQVVTTYTPGRALLDSVSATEHAEAEPPARRKADLEWAANVKRRPQSLAVEVLLVCAPTAAGQVADSLRSAGFRGVKVTDPDSAVDGGFGFEHVTAFEDETGWHRTWFVDGYPGAALEPGWLERLVPAGCTAALAWHAAPLPTAWVVDYLQRQLAAMRASRLSGSDDPHLDSALPTAESFQQRLVAREERAFRVATYLTLTAPDVAALDAASALVGPAAQASLCSLQPCHFGHRAGRLATLPYGVDPLSRTRVLDSSSLASFLPWLHAEVEQASGVPAGITSARGRPVLLDPFDQARFANANIGVFGHSGAGKTFLVSSLILGAHAAGAQVFVIDPEHEYGGLAAATGGVDVPLALGSGHALNVLHLPEGPRDEALLGPAVADAVDLVGIICGSLDEADRALVEVAVRGAFGEVERPVLGDVAARLPAPSRAGIVLRRWTAGSLGGMFSAETTADLDAPMVVFGMRELRDELVAPVHFLLAEALWAQIKDRARRRLLVIDELGLIFEDPTIRRFVVNLARRIRKYDGSLVFATQNPGDLLASEAGAVVATNPAIHFFGSTRPVEARRLQAAFELSDTQRAQVETARRGEFLLSAGPERVAVRIEPPPWQTAVIRGVSMPGS